MHSENIVGTVTQTDRLAGLIELETSEGHRFSMPVIMLERSGFDCVDLLS